MRVIAGADERGPLISLIVVLGALSVLTLTVPLGYPALTVAPLVAGATIFALGYRALLTWHALLAITIGLILFVPIRRYRLPGELPFELEPYRLVVMIILAGWVSSLLVDPRVRLRRSGFEGPLCLIVIAILGSILANQGRVASVEPEVIKKVTFFASFLVLFYLVVSVVKPQHADFLVKVLVGCGAVVGVFALVEARTGFNVFNQIGNVVPFVNVIDLPTEQGRAGRLRVTASAQHSIALGAALVMLIPLGIYLVRRTRARIWWLAVALLGLGALATVARTTMVMVVVLGVVFLWLRPRETKRLWPVLLPAVLVIHFALPGTIGGLKKSFFPEGGLIAEQRYGSGTRGSGRIADLGPGLREFSRRPLVGQGYGTRVVDKERQNAPILDNQWLGTLLELGLLGALAWLWTFTRAIRRFARLAKQDVSEQGWLFAGLTASIFSYAVSMLTYDAFAFIQVTFLLFILVAIGAALSRQAPLVPAKPS
jgi:O-antigen ligase